MGMYTRCVLNVAIKEDAPIIEELERMIEGEGSGEGRRAWMLNGSSYYHDAINHKQLEHDSVSKCYKFSCCFDIKNYENEIAWFLQWLAPHVETEDCAGYWRYEESIAPTLIYFAVGRVLEFEPTLPAEITKEGN